MVEWKNYENNTIIMDFILSSYKKENSDFNKDKKIIHFIFGLFRLVLFKDLIIRSDNVKSNYEQYCKWHDSLIIKLDKEINFSNFLKSRTLTNQIDT